MTLDEFKAWMEGFGEAIDGNPTPAQWKKIQKKLKATSGSITTIPVYVEKYRPSWPYQPYWTYTNHPNMTIGTFVADNSTDTVLMNNCGDGGSAIISERTEESIQGAFTGIEEYFADFVTQGRADAS